jgi:ADP-heptose:LPS heptosyltransferase
VVVLGPEDSWAGPSEDGIAPARGSLLELAALLHGADAAVGNDSGLTHVAAAVGTVPVVVFGPTTPGLGFLPVGPHRVRERLDLNCRPCSVHGGARCPRGDHACLAGVTVGSVLVLLDTITKAARPRIEVIHAR